MARSKRATDGLGNTYVRIHCPGCDSAHMVRVAGPGGMGAGPKWDFNDNFDMPTIAPSILVTYPANPDADDDFAEWRQERKCHSYVRNGRIEFLSDCTHALASKTVDLPEVVDG